MTRINLPQLTSPVNLYDDTKLLLDEFYTEHSELDRNINLFNFIKQNYLNSTFYTLVKLYDSVNLTLDLNTQVMVANIIYRLKGLKEGIEYLFNTIMGAKVNIQYDYQSFNLTMSVEDLRVINIYAFTKALESLVNELLYTKSYILNIKRISLNIPIDNPMYYDDILVKFNDYRISTT